MSPKIDQMLITGYGSLDCLVSKFDLEIAELSDKSDLVSSIISVASLHPAPSYVIEILLPILPINLFKIA